MSILRSNLRLPFDLTLINLGVTSFQDHSAPEHLPKISTMFRSRSSKPSAGAPSHPSSLHIDCSKKPAEPIHDPPTGMGSNCVPQKRPRISRDSTPEIDGKKLVLARRDYKSEARTNVLSKRAERALMDTQAGLHPGTIQNHRPMAAPVPPQPQPSLPCTPYSAVADHTATVQLEKQPAAVGAVGDTPSTSAPEALVPSEMIARQQTDAKQASTPEVKPPQQAAHVEDGPAVAERLAAPIAARTAVCYATAATPEASDACGVVAHTPTHDEHAHEHAYHPCEHTIATQHDGDDVTGNAGPSIKPTPASWDSYSFSPPKMQDFAGLPGVVAYQSVYEDATLTDTTASPLPSQLTSQVLSDSVGDRYASTPTSQLGPASGVLSSANLINPKSSAECDPVAEASHTRGVNAEASVADGFSMEASKRSEPAAQTPTRLLQAHGSSVEHASVKHACAEAEGAPDSRQEVPSSSKEKVGAQGKVVIRLPSLKAALAQCKSTVRQLPPKLPSRTCTEQNQKTEQQQSATNSAPSRLPDDLQPDCAAQKPPCIPNTSEELQSSSQHTVLPPASVSGHVVLLLHLDSFFCQVEVKDNPELAGSPVAIQDAPGGPLLACSSEAQAQDVHCTEGPVNQEEILTRCPHLILRPPRRARYTQECTTLLAALQNLLEGSTPMPDPRDDTSPPDLFEVPEHSAGCTVQASDSGSFYFNVTSACAKASMHRANSANLVKQQHNHITSSVFKAVETCEERGHAASLVGTSMHACRIACEADVKQFAHTLSPAGTDNAGSSMQGVEGMSASAAAPTWDDVASDLIEGCKLAVRLTEIMRRMHSYHASVAVSRTRLLSRLLLRMAPSQGVTVLPPCRVHAFMKCMPLTLIPALAGKAGADIRKSLEIKMVGELEKWSEGELAERFGAARARMLKALIQGGYDTGVEEAGERGYVDGLGKVAVERSYQIADRPDTVAAAIRPLAQSLLTRLERCVSAQKQLPMKLTLEWRNGIDATQYRTISMPARVCARLRPLLHSDTTEPVATTNMAAPYNSAAAGTQHPTDTSPAKSTSTDADAGGSCRDVHTCTPTKTPERPSPGAAALQLGAAGDGGVGNVDGSGISVHARAVEAIVAAVSSQIGATVTTANSIARISMCATFDDSTSATPNVSQQRIHSFLSSPSSAKQTPTKTPIKSPSPASKLRAFFQSGSARTPSKPSCSNTSAQQQSPEVKPFQQSSQEQLSPALLLNKNNTCACQGRHEPNRDPPPTSTAVRTKQPPQNYESSNSGSILPSKVQPVSTSPAASPKVSTLDVSQPQRTYPVSPSPRNQKQGSVSPLQSLKSLKSKLVQQLSPQPNPHPSSTVAQPHPSTSAELATTARKPLDHLQAFAAAQEPPLLPTRNRRTSSPLKPPAVGFQKNETHSVPSVPEDRSILCIDDEPVEPNQVQTSSSITQHAQLSAQNTQACVHNTQVLSNTEYRPGLNQSSNKAACIVINSDGKSASATTLKQQSDGHAYGVESEAQDVYAAATGVNGGLYQPSLSNCNAKHSPKSQELLEPASTAPDKALDGSVEHHTAHAASKALQDTSPSPPEEGDHTQDPAGPVLSADNQAAKALPASPVTAEERQCAKGTAHHVPSVQPIVDMCNEGTKSPSTAPSSGGPCVHSQPHLNLKAQQKVLEDAVRGAHAQRQCGYKGAAQNGALDVDMRLALRMQEEELARASHKKGGVNSPSPKPVRASTVARSGATKKPTKSSRQSATSMKQLESFFGGPRSKK